MPANEGVLPARWIETDEEIAEERYVWLAFHHLATFQRDLTPVFLTQTFVLRRLYSSRGVARQYFLLFFRVLLSFCLPFVSLAHHLAFQPTQYVVVPESSTGWNGKSQDLEVRATTSSPPLLPTLILTSSFVRPVSHRRSCLHLLCLTDNACVPSIFAAYTPPSFSLQSTDFYEPARV